MIIVISDKPNITHLPYKTKKRQGVYPFVPGRNEIDAEIFASVKALAGTDDWDGHYGTFLRPVGGDEAELVEIKDLNAHDFIDLIQATMEVETLNEYRQFESGGAQRKTVVAAIDGQIEAIMKIAETKSKKDAESNG